MSLPEPLATRWGTSSKPSPSAQVRSRLPRRTRAVNCDAPEDNVNKDDTKPIVCPTCGAVTTATGHLCRPFELTQPHVCEYCGAETDDPRHMCYPQIEHLAYQCRHCGRLAAKAEALCHPKRIAGTS